MDTNDNPPQNFDGVTALWDELSRFGGHESDAASKVLMQRVGGWIEAQNAFWVGLVHVMKEPDAKRADPMHGWRIRSISPLHAQYHDPALNRKIVKATTPPKDPGATNITLMRAAGAFRAHSLQSGRLVDLESFQETEHYDFYYRQRRVHDRIWVIFPVNEDTESCFCFDRIDTQRPFTQEQLDLAAFASRGIRWFHNQLLLNHGLGLCEDPVTPAERRIIQALLTGQSEKEIAAEQGLSQGTVHQYATRVYRKFGVRGRHEFMALWLAGGG